MENSPRCRSSACVLAVTALLAVAMIGVAFWRGRGPRIAQFGHQPAESPLVMPEKGALDMRFNFPAVWQSVAIPRALRFDPPIGTEHGSLVYNAQKFWEMNDRRGGHHTGDDLNGIGGMNTDLGDPVFSVADGLVIFAGEPSPGWGNVVVVAHLAADGKPLQSMYAHLDRIQAKLGALIARGDKIGTVGTANGYYPAHLHFEMRAGESLDIGGGYAQNPLNRLDPAATILKYHNAAAEVLCASPFSTITAELAGR